MPGNRTLLNFSTERRARFRYPLELNVRYRTLLEGQSMAGTGRTQNVSSSGLLIVSVDQTVEDGARIQISVDWPFALNGETLLQLSADCRVIRRQSAGFAVRIDHYQFRTQSSRVRENGSDTDLAACSPVFA